MSQGSIQAQREIGNEGTISFMSTVVEETLQPESTYIVLRTTQI